MTMSKGMTDMTDSTNIKSMYQLELTVFKPGVIGELIICVVAVDAPSARELGIAKAKAMLSSDMNVEVNTVQFVSMYG